MRTAIFLFAACSGLLQAAAETFAVPGNLKADGLAPIQRLVFDEVGRYNESRSAALDDWHPTRREILLGTRFDDMAQLHHVAMPSSCQKSDIWPENPRDPQSAGMLLPVNESGWSINDRSRDGAQMLVTREVSAVVSELYLLDVATGKKTQRGPASVERWTQSESGGLDGAPEGQSIPGYQGVRNYYLNEGGSNGGYMTVAVMTHYSDRMRCADLRRVEYGDAALRKNDVAVWCLLADDEGHGYAKKKNRDFLNAATAEFVQQYLLGEK